MKNILRYDIFLKEQSMDKLKTSVIIIETCRNKSLAS